ncbi:hypothetical protein [Planktotalea sp.]|uniref:hypothetical protein n=1 Tax=Planktotalea sp. TaxID=2029877 RepID=UPI003D6AB84B
MFAIRITLCGALALGVAGCNQHNEPMISSRGAASEHVLASSLANEEVMMEQAGALTKMTRDIIRKSTVQGAAVGAVAGCGLAILSASNAKNCVTGVIAGGAVGALTGNAVGKKQAQNRVQLVSPSALVRSIGKADDRMDVVSRDLPGMLAAQDAELNTLTLKMAQGEITEAQYTQRFEVIKANRAQLAEALSLSATQANEAHRNLQEAQAKGQSGLDWHLSATKNLARDATSARSAITLL